MSGDLTYLNVPSAGISRGLPAEEIVVWGVSKPPGARRLNGLSTHAEGVSPTSWFECVKRRELRAGLARGESHPVV